MATICNKQLRVRLHALYKPCLWVLFFFFCLSAYLRNHFIHRSNLIMIFHALRLKWSVATGYTYGWINKKSNLLPRLAYASFPQGNTPRAGQGKSTPVRQSLGPRKYIIVSMGEIVTTIYYDMVSLTGFFSYFCTSNQVGQPTLRIAETVPCG